MIKIKLCPYLPQKREVKALAIGNGDAVITYFAPCLLDDCAAFLTGKCMYGGANIDVVKEESVQ